jgi:hypothetical protein
MKSAAKIESAGENPPLRLFFSLFQNSFKSFAVCYTAFFQEMKFYLPGTIGPAVFYLCSRFFAIN